MGRPRAAVVLAALAALLLGLTALEHARALPLWGARFHGFLFVPLAALALLARELQRRPRRAPVVAALLSFLLFTANGRELGSGDTAPTTALPYMVLRHGTLSLDPLAPLEPRPYWAAPSGGRLWSEYPVAPALLALPAFVPAALGPAGPLELREPGKLAAAAICAAATGLVLATLLRLGVGLGFASLVTLLFAAGSPVLSTAAQALWQHGPGILGLAGMIWAVVRARASPRAAWLAGAFGGLALASRATDVLLVAAVWLAVLAKDRRAALRFALAAAVPALLVALYNAYAFGAPWRTGYGAAGAGELGAHFRLFELLLSPTRGLLLYVPWALVAAVGLVLGARRDPLYAALGLGSLATLALYATWQMWWGGWSYGPRLLADLMPALAIGLAPLAGLRWRGAAGAALAATGAAAIGLHGLYAFAPRSAPARAVREIDGEAQAGEWRRFPLASLLADDGGRTPAAAPAGRAPSTRPGATR